MTLYTGDLKPKLAIELLKSDKDSVLVDVRTSAEWQTVGKPDLGSIDKEPIFIEWRLLPDMQKNADFADRLLKQVPSRSTKLLFLCKTGGRSQEAAMLAQSLGYKECYNIEEGFEGDADSKGHRGSINGWKAENLPWRQD